MSNMNATEAELLQFCEQFEQCEAEIADVRERQKELRSEMKARGFDTKAFARVLKKRKFDADTRAEMEALDELYEGILLV